jgi:hypothetical protein
MNTFRPIFKSRFHLFGILLMFGIFMAPHTNAASSSFTWFVNSNVDSGTNINSATELGIINMPIGDVDLSESGQKIEDDFMDIGAGFNYNYPFDKNRSAFA